MGSGLSQEERSECVSNLRIALEPDGLNATDVQLESFLVARDYDVQAAAQMWRENKAWRSLTLPIERTEGIERILQSRRYRSLGCNRDGRLVLVFDAMWGKFLEGEDEAELLSAFLLHFDEQLALADAQPNQQFAFIHIAVGGPPPFAWGRKLSQTLEANYPERLHRAVIFPVPWIMRRVVNSMLWFLPKRTQEKFMLVSDLAALADACSLDEESFPEDIRNTNIIVVANNISCDVAAQLWTPTETGDHRTVRPEYVKAGRSTLIQVDIASEVEWVEWRCDVDPGYDVCLHVFFEPIDSESETSQVVLHASAHFIDCQIGQRFEPQGKGKLVFAFDNSHSWINGKNVVAEVTTHRTDDGLDVSLPCQ